MVSCAGRISSRKTLFVSLGRSAAFLVGLFALAPSGTAHGIEEAVEALVTEQTLPNWETPLCG